MRTASPLAVETLPFRRLLDEAMVRVRGSLRTLFLPLAVVSGLLTALTAVFNVLFFEEFLALGAAGAQAQPNLVRGCLYYGAMLGTSLLSFYVYLLGFVGALDATAGRPVQLGRRAVDLLRPSIFFTLFLMLLLMAFSYLACILPFALVGPLLIFTLPVIFDEGLRGPAALGRASRLARHNPARELLTHPMFKLFVLFFVGSLLSMAVNFVLQVPLQMALQWQLFQGLESQGAGHPATGMQGLLWIQVPLSLVSGALVAGVFLYQGFGLALLFFDTRERKEGGDLEAAIERVEEERRRRRGGGEP